MVKVPTTYPSYNITSVSDQVLLKNDDGAWIQYALVESTTADMILLLLLFHPAVCYDLRDHDQKSHTSLLLL